MGVLEHGRLAQVAEMLTASSTKAQPSFVFQWVSRQWRNSDPSGPCRLENSRPGGTHSLTGHRGAHAHGSASSGAPMGPKQTPEGR